MDVGCLSQHHAGASCFDKYVQQVALCCMVKSTPQIYIKSLRSSTSLLQDVLQCKPSQDKVVRECHKLCLDIEYQEINFQGRVSKRPNEFFQAGHPQFQNSRPRGICEFSFWNFHVEFWDFPGPAFKIPEFQPAPAVLNFELGAQSSRQ